MMIIQISQEFLTGLLTGGGILLAGWTLRVRFAGTVEVEAETKTKPKTKTNRRGR